MSQVMVPELATAFAPVDELVTISIHDTLIVVDPTTRWDALRTQVVTDIVNAAGVAAETVLLNGCTPIRDLSESSVMPSRTTDEADRSVPAEMVATGMLSIRCATAVWTIDMVGGRFVRSNTPLDRLTLRDSDWTTFERMWIAPQSVHTLTSARSYVTGNRLTRQLAHPNSDSTPRPESPSVSRSA